ncbi:hypothetical protein CE91St43_27960 [Oscillospiraceae bacterium]|nr:hypothetical protein CE91St43_27960 [Oscillospiraceae bacterium]
MSGKKLWKEIDHVARFSLAAGAIALTGMTVWAGVTAFAAQPGPPTLLFRCMDFKLIEDGSIQALVRLSVENTEKFAATAFNIQFNPDYIRPSYLEMGSGGEKQTLVTAVTGSERTYYSEDSALLIDVTGQGRRSPFKSVGEEGYKYSEVVPGKDSAEAGGPINGSINMYLRLDQDILNTMDPNHNVVKWMDIYGGTENKSYIYINASGVVDPENGKDGYSSDGAGTSGPGKGVNLGELSFQVNPDHLADMVKKFSDTTGSGSDFLIGYPTDPDENWMLTELIQDYDDTYITNKHSAENPYGPNGDVSDPNSKAQVIFEFIFPKVLVKAEVAGGAELTVNAYQAFTSGTSADIASTIQRYRPEITGTYADATQENFILNWGDTAAGYAVYRPVQVGETPDYTRASDGTEWKALTGYTSKGGEYLVTQYFYYEEDGANKKYPLPMEVHLTVSEVELTGVNATGLEGTYSETQAAAFLNSGHPDTLEDLALPNKAVLGLSPVPGSFVLTMPVDTWTPNALNTLKTTEATPQDWPAAGEYALAGPDNGAIRDYVSAHYPWVTIPDAFTEGLSARRTVADYTDRHYVATHVSTGDKGILTLRVEKQNDAGVVQGFDPEVAFRTYLPDGTLIDTIDDLPKVPVAPADDTSFYLPSPGGSGVYNLTYYPGSGTLSAGGENVRRSINLGGWFYVSVQEDGGQWSELIPVYAPPRTNYYTDSYLVGDGTQFDFTGLHAGLYPFYSDSVLPSHVVLPIGYGVNTTYDGATGAQPGRIGQFRAVDAGWTCTADGGQTAPVWGTDSVVTYGGPADFEEAAYPGYGRVDNAAAPDEKKVQMQVQAPAYVADPSGGADQPVPDPKGDDKIRLYHEGDSHLGVTWTGTTPDEVSEITYTVQTEGYVARQTFTLTIENTGTTDLYGLSVDTDHGGHTPDNGSHFEVLQAPAPYLPAGGKTTFTVTYVYNLSGNDSSVLYRDLLLITSNSYDKDDPLKSFYAQFEVTSKAVYNVSVVTDPVDGSMGTAKIVTGMAGNQPILPAGTPQGATITATGIANRPAFDPAVDVYAVDHEYVWIYAEPTDENEVKEVYYMNGAVKVPLYVYKYEKDSAVAEDTDVVAYFFQMPAKDVVVHVDFYEPVMAKLRMSLLKAYAGTEAQAGTGIGATLIQEDYRQNVRWYENTPNVIQVDPGMTESDSSQEKYLVVLGDNADATKASDGSELKKVQLYLKLRKNELSPDIDDVKVYITDTSNGSALSNTTTDEQGKTWHETAGAPTEHQTSIFDAPVDPNDPDALASKTVEITLSCVVTTPTPDYPTASTGAPVPVSRTFQVVIVRRGKDIPYQMLYGNSPKGMIYNDSTLTTDADRADAWSAFLAENRFAAGKTPAKAAALKNTYWPEAWGKVSSANHNYDQDEKALFVILGEPFQDPGIHDVKNSAGLPVDPADISRSVVVDLLDEAAATQKERFLGQQTTAGTVDTVELDLGQADTGRADDSATGTIDNWWQTDDGSGTVYDYAIRPGVYTLCYTFKDYDGTTDIVLKRPMIVLARVGDVDANRQAEHVDGELIQNRVADPLGDTAAASFPDWRLYRYRVCDVNNDRNINNIDANKLYYGVDQIVPYYKPTDYIS